MWSKKDAYPKRFGMERKMSNILEGVKLVPSFTDEGVSCYRLENENYVNRYYVVSDAGTRKLLF